MDLLYPGHRLKNEGVVMEEGAERVRREKTMRLEKAPALRLLGGRKIRRAMSTIQFEVAVAAVMEILPPQSHGFIKSTSQMQTD